MKNLTENNHEEMRTEVQTYVIEETQELIYDNEKLDEWNNLIADLGLAGQTQIVKPKKSPIPFLCINNTQTEILSTLCSRNVSIQEYDLTPIPVEILNLVALSKKEGYFKEIEIWYDEKQKDPACIGLTGYWRELSWYDNSNESIKDAEFETKEDAKAAGANHPSFYEDKKYLLGRWADVKEDFKQLALRAKERFIGEQKNDIDSRIKDANRELEDLNNKSFDKFGV